MFSRKKFSSGSLLFKQETYKNGLSKFIKTDSASLANGNLAFFQINAS